MVFFNQLFFNTDYYNFIKLYLLNIDENPFNEIKNLLNSKFIDYINECDIPDNIVQKKYLKYKYLYLINKNF